MDDLKSAAGPGGSSRVAYVFFDGCSSTAGWVGAGPILIYVHPTGRLRVPQLMSPKVGITIRMAHAQYGMLDQVDALKRSLQNRKLGWFRIWTLPLKFCQGI